MTHSDTDILDELKSGSQMAFRRFVDDYKKQVFNLVLGFVRNPEDAEDIAQEVFVQAYQSLRDFQGDCTLSTWLYRIATNKSLDALRSRKRKKRFAVLVSLFGEDDELVIDPAEEIHPGVLMEDQERSRILFSAVDSLPEQQKVAFTLARIEGMTVQGNCRYDADELQIRRVIALAGKDEFATKTETLLP